MTQDTLLTLLAFTALAALAALGTVLLRKGRTEDEARAYLAGVTYVLSDDPDRAIEELTKAARLNTQTYDTYFALAELFRRKGELARALRLHQNILLRPGAPDHFRRRAQLELALDYRRSGLKDQAIAAFERMLTERPKDVEALLHYRQFLEEIRDLDGAIQLQQRLIEADGGGLAILGNLLAEHARELVAEHPYDALALTGRAIALAPGSANAQLSRAEALIAVGQAKGAAEPLKQALTLEPERAPPSLGLLKAALGAPDEVRRWLEEEQARQPQRAAPLELALALWNKQEGRAELALSQLRVLVERRPQDWHARRELGALLLQQDRSDELRQDYADILEALGKPVLGFRCRACEQRLPEHGFRCPICGSWDSIRREQGRAAGAIAPPTSSQG